MRLSPLLYIVAAVVAVGSVAFAACCPLFATDAACRYAPMAEAFAAGNWAEAFHPRFGVGMPTVAGLVRLLTGMDGYSSCAAVSTLAWALSMLPVFWVAEKVFGERAAWFALILYVICPQPLIWGLKGLREPFKMLGFLLMADALFRCRVTACSESALCRSKGYASAVEASLALLLLFTFKCDALAIGGVLAVVYAVMDRFGRNTCIVAAAGILSLQPMCALVHLWTGYWLPAPQYVRLLRMMCGG